MDGLTSGAITSGAVEVAVVVIGRNEGDRLRRCLASIPHGIPAVYVDSGSSDDSVAFARSRQVTVVELDMSRGFTAARARNAGWRALAAQGITAEMVQFADGDCELDPNWIATARAALLAEPGLAVVFGRRRERYPDASLYNRLCDQEWNVPVGLVNACGGDALIRFAALREVDGYCDDLIAGEEPDMCLRLRRAGWTIRRIDAEMTLHDAAIHSFGAWWRRTRRAGFAYAAHVLRHGAGADPEWRRQVRSITVWGMLWPLALVLLALACAVWSPRLAAVILLLILASYAVQITRIARRRQADGLDRRLAWEIGATVMLGKFAEFSGVAQCWSDRLRDRSSRIIEYKS